MFTLLFIDSRDGIRSAVKYLLYRYDLLCCEGPEEAAAILEKNHIDMVIVSLPVKPGPAEDLNILREKTRNKKTIVLLETAAPRQKELAGEWGALDYLDKMDIVRLPQMVNQYLNQAATRILNI
jgi:DNA-binding NtrC family response regulator